MDKVRIAAIQTKVAEGRGCNEVNMRYALERMDEASKGGAHIMTFPETFPGPWREPYDGFDPFEELSSKARQVGKYIIYGTSERADEAPGRHHIVLKMIGPNGKLVAKYCRTTPRGPWIYPGGSFWDLNYIGAGEENLRVYDTELGKISLLVCSEVYVPELSRILALKGAEITFLPAGLNKYSLIGTWEILLRARAIENLMYTVSCNNIREEDEKDAGLAVICGPEGELVKSNKEEILFMDADLERLRWLRQAEDATDAAKNNAFKSKPSALTMWRKPEMYKDLLGRFHGDNEGGGKNEN